MSHRIRDCAGNRQALRRAVACLCAFVAVVATNVSTAQDVPPPAPVWVAPVVPADGVVITEPILDVRTGPGRGFPVTFAVARGDWVRIVLRRTDWFRIRAADGREGWVHRTQLDAMLAGGGPQRTFRDGWVDRLLTDRLEVGGEIGRHLSDPMAKLWGAVRVTETLSVVATIGHLQGSFAGGEFKTVALQSEPWAGARWSPVFAIGAGRVNGYPLSPEAQDGVTYNGTLAVATLGLKYNFNAHFSALAEVSLHTVYIGTTRIREYTAPAVGLAYFF